MLNKAEQHSQPPDPLTAVSTPPSWISEARFAAKERERKMEEMKKM